MLERLAERIHQEVFRPSFDYKTTVFLCGAGAKSTRSVRRQIDHLLTAEGRSYLYDMFYPEDLFNELLLGPGHHDLMTLENILADSVDAIVIVVESYGSVAELAAFAGNPALRSKLVCVVDKQYKKAKSFINYGPLRLLRSLNTGSIIYGDFQNVPGMMEKIRRSIYATKKGLGKTPNVDNVLQTHHFILPSIFLLEPVARDVLIELVKYASRTDTGTATALTTGALSILAKKREIESGPDGYGLTEIGMDHFTALGSRGWTKRSFSLHSMDQIRVGILNWQYRGKPLKV